MARNAHQPRASLTLPIILLLHIIVCSSSVSDSEILLKFKDSLQTNGPLSSWNSSKSPCSGNKGNWAGVLCENGAIWGLQLESMELKGNLNLDSLVDLSSLRTLSFMNNSFDGPLPNIKQLGALKSVFFSKNKFGEIQENAFDGMSSLKKVHLAENEFTGSIPLSLTILPKLLEVRLEDNHFEGDIPDFKQSGLLLVNVSNNALEGPIPGGLSKMNASSFSGNKFLCGLPLDPCPSSAKISVATIIIVAIVIVAALSAIAAVFVILRRRRRQTRPPETSSPASQTHKKLASADLDRLEQGSPEHAASNTGKKPGENGKLSFLRDDREKFDLPDLLKANAEILGSGCFGSSYKAALLSGSVMVVKRFRQMNNVGKEEFQEHMRRLGRLRHPNLLPLVAFYYRKEEKLLVFDYVDNVSLAVHLHGNHNRGQPSLDWPTRLKIVKGVARGLLYLNNELPSLIAPHGHLKSSNVLLNESFEPLVTDYGLVPVVNQEQAQDLMVAYKSPEYRQHGRITKKTDVWSLGILILEILTGKFPANHLHQGKGSDTDLATWVQSVVREELTMEVFDKEMGLTKNSEGEMLKLLKIGLDCCESGLDKRSDLKEAVGKIEEVRERDHNGDHEEFYSSYASESDVHSSRGLSDDFHFSMNG